MSHGFRLFGHPLHPMMNHVPMGTWLVSVPFDVLGLWSESPLWWAVSFWSIVAGLAAAAPTVLSGMVDYAVNVRGPRPERLAILHMTLMLIVAGLFALSLVCRHGPEPVDSASRLLATGCDCIGALMLVVGGWFGGELVYGHDVGLRDSSASS
jgi:uncharacterized membrane protein